MPVRRLRGTSWLTAALILVGAGSTPATASLCDQLVLVCSPDSDLHAVLGAVGSPCLRFDDAAAAIEAAPVGGGLAILAQGYPETKTPLDAGTLAAADAKGLRVFVEYPAVAAWLAGSPATAAPLDVDRERVVVASGGFGELPSGRLLEVFGARFVPLDAAEPGLVLSRVAGYDTASFGITGASWPLLFEVPGAELMVSATALSRIVRGRYAPTGAWAAVWSQILGWLVPGEAVPELVWAPSVRPSFGAAETVPVDGEALALARGAAHLVAGRFLRHAEWPADALALSGVFNAVGPAPEADWPVGDGSLGALEGYVSRIGPDGEQPLRYGVRSDCMTGLAMALAFDAASGGPALHGEIAANLLDYVYFESELAQGPRAVVGSPSEGLVAWSEDNVGLGVYYDGDTARTALGAITAAALLGESRWDEAILRQVVAIFRTTGIHGFHQGLMYEADLQALGWEHYWNLAWAYSNPPYLWLCFLWAWERTGWRPFLDKVKAGAALLMGTWGSWPVHPNHSQQPLFAHALLPLAWLVRVEDTPLHRQWLALAAMELLAAQQPSGAIREVVVHEGPVVASNAAYGATETGIVQEAGDPASDLLYTTGFAAIGLQEAAEATGDEVYSGAAGLLVDFLVRAQIRSEAHGELDGGWYRGFDDERWEFWGSDADIWWGVWSLEDGWTAAWVLATLGLRELGTSLWEVAGQSAVDAETLAGIAPGFAPGGGAPLAPTIPEDVLGAPGDGLVPTGVVTCETHQELALGGYVGVHGSSARLVAQDLSGEMLAGPWALELWARVAAGPDADPLNQYLLEFGANAPGVPYGYDDHELELFWADGTRTDGLVVADEAWHHVVFVTYGDATAGVADRISVWLDGAEVAGVADDAAAAGLDLSASLAVGGTRLDSVFMGGLDELAVYDLSGLGSEAEVDAKATELAAHYAVADGGDYGGAVWASGPTRYWSFGVCEPSEPGPEPVDDVGPELVAEIGPEPLVEIGPEPLVEIGPEPVAEAAEVGSDVAEDDAEVEPGPAFEPAPPTGGCGGTRGTPMGWPLAAWGAVSLAVRSARVRQTEVH